MSEPELPLVSIVTPCLNAARFIEETIESVLAQDYPRIEYIVMDGGSTDGTFDILRRYELQPERFKWTSEQDRGAADAINRGFAQSPRRNFHVSQRRRCLSARRGLRRRAGVQRIPKRDVVYGGGVVDRRVGRADRAPIRFAISTRDLLARECFICQPASFPPPRSVRKRGRHGSRSASDLRL